MKALCWTGINKTSIETVDDPRLLNDRDAIVKVTLSSTCGSDLHLLGGYIPGMRAGDLLGHEFMGEIVEVGAAIRKHRVGDRVVVVDKFPLGAIVNKGLTFRGAQQHGHRYIPMILDRIAAGEISTEHLATHVIPLAGGPRGYAMFKNKEDGCVRAVFRPGS